MYTKILILTVAMEVAGSIQEVSGKFMQLMIEKLGVLEVLQKYTGSYLEVVFDIDKQFIFDGKHFLSRLRWEHKVHTSYYWHRRSGQQLFEDIPEASQKCSGSFLEVK